MVVVDDVMLFWLLCCVGVWNKRRVIVALLVDPLALVIVEVVRLVPSRLICFCPLLLCDRVFFTKCRFVYLSPMLSGIGGVKLFVGLNGRVSVRVVSGGCCCKVSFYFCICCCCGFVLFSYV